MAGCGEIVSLCAEHAGVVAVVIHAVLIDGLALSVDRLIAKLAVDCLGHVLYTCVLVESVSEVAGKACSSG